MSLKTVWNHKNVAHAWKIGFPHLLLRETPWWVNKCGIYLFCSDLLLFSKKIGKIVHDANRYKMMDTKGPSINTRTSLPKSAKASSLFRLSYICMGDIGKLFKPKTWSFHLNSNSQPVFKNYQYFMISKSNFGAFFQDKFSLCGITPNHSRFKLWLVEMFFFSKI